MDGAGQGFRRSYGLSTATAGCREDAHSQIQAAAEAGAAWGCFHIGFDYNGPFMGCNTFFSNRRARRGIAFGDQGIWIRRELFLSLGGFPELPIMEDYEFHYG